MDNSKLTYMPSFITSPTKEGLMKKMLENNTKDNTSYRYYSILKDGNNWVAWFYKDILDGRLQKLN